MKPFRIILLTTLMYMATNNVLAYDIAVKNSDGKTIYYNYINEGKELEVTYEYAMDIFDTSTRYCYRGNIVIPEEVTFMNRTRKVTSIGDDAFGQCREMTSITIPNSVTTIGNWAFCDCKGLTSITIPSNVKYIKNGAFNECNGLESVYIFDLETWLSYNWDISNPLRYATNLYINDEKIEDLIIPDGVKSISKNAFYAWKGVKSVTIPNSVTSIESNAFSHCSNLTSVTIPSSVTSIGHYAFYDCTSLLSVTIPNNVISIGEGAFAGSGLTSVNIPNSVTSIGEYAFGGMDLTTVISNISNPFPIDGRSQTNPTFSDNTFYNATLLVPEGSIENYKATEGWKDFIFIEENINETSITPIVLGDKRVDIYSLNGNRLLSPNKGINIIKLEDGTRKKVLAK